MIEVPGYRILKPLGRGGMASVYLAIQESVDREVALKVMAPTLLGDPQFGERFLREARIAAKLRHPHVVQVHDVGQFDEIHYMAMEYLPNGSVIAPGASPRGLRYALRVTREIASALGYAHARGVVHRDIKPDNILLREDGASALTDFGIARASDNVRMTRTGSIMGTPSYMSPEQAQGFEIDGRADLYSLGIVFYELLVGRLPFTAQDSISVGVMHITAPVPSLPPELSWLQPLINRLLAKEPAARFQNGSDLAQALADIESRFTPSPIGVPQGHNSQATTQLVEPDSDDDQRGDTEPTLGQIDPDLLAAAAARRRGGRRPRREGSGSRLWLWLGLLLLVGVGVSAWQFQDRLRDLLPQTAVDQALDKADQAMREGRLAQLGGQQPGAAELYEQVLARDPENQRALQGRQRLGEQWMRRARNAIDSESFAEAEQALNQAKRYVPASQTDPLQTELQQRSVSERQIRQLLDAADAALRAGRIDQGGDSALMLYSQVLKLSPDNALAKAGQGEALIQLFAQARTLADRGQLDEAGRVLDRVAEIEPANLQLPDARAYISEQRQAGSAALSKELSQADQLLSRGRLTGSGSALAAYRAVLAKDPNNEAAKAGVQNVIGRLQAALDRALADYEIDRADGLLADLSEAGASARQIASLQARIDEAAERVASLNSRMNADRDPARLNQMLQQAEQAIGNGQLFAPPGESAFDLFSRVLSADPKNATARAGRDRLAGEARRRFEEALAASKLSSARGYVEGLESYRADDPGLPGMKRRLASLYLGDARQRIERNELAQARRSLNYARELDPNNPDSVELQARLDRAGGT